LSKSQIAEIFVFGQQYPIFLVRAFHDLGIGRPRRNVGHVNDVVPKVAQLLNKGHVNAFIDQPAHPVQP
jgi:hypothetical protein